MLVRKLFKFEAAHRTLGAYTKRCHGLHGHSYKVEVILRDDKLDKAQMLMDFKYLKDTIGKYIDCFDHSIIVWEKDLKLAKAAHKLNPRVVIVPYNSTAEQMARHFYKVAKSYDLPVDSIIVHETETGYAQYFGEDLNDDFDIDDVTYSP